MNTATTLDNKQFYKKLVSVELPIILSGIVSSSLSLLDNLMVGSLGETALSGTGLAGQTMFIQWMITFGLCSGCSTFYAQFWGVKDVKNIRKVIGLNWLFTIPVGVLFMVLALTASPLILRLFTDAPELIETGGVYLRYVFINFLAVGFCQPLYMALKATQQTRIPMMISVSSFVIDVVLNYMLIFGNLGCPALGVKGAAIATGAARFYEIVMLIIVIFVRGNVIAGPIRDFFSFDKAFAKRVLRNVVPTTSNEAMWGIGTAAYSAVYGRLGVTAYAAVQACSTVMDVFMQAGFAMGDASLIFVGEALGRNDKKEARLISRKLIVAGLVISMVTGVIVVGAGPLFLQLFDLTDEGRLLAGKVLIAKAIGIPLNVMVAIFIAGVFRSGGDTRFAAILEICTMYLVGIPVVAIGGLLLRLPVYWVIVCSYLELAVKLTLCFVRYRSGKWLNNVIDELRTEE